MKKLIFNKFYINTTKFFLSTLLMMGIIVWTIQAVNYFDFVTEDGHGLRVYFLYTILSFPKIINRLLPFIFFISIFYILISYEKRNELNIFWINGINKITFMNKILIFSLILTIIQIYLGSHLSPLSQFKARDFLKNSNIDFFTSLVKPGKFINIAKNMTIFIEKKNEDKTFKNIFIEDNRNTSRMIYAKNGQLVLDNENKKFELLDGRIINNEKSSVNIFKFDKINLNLSNIKTKTITTPKIQELKTVWLLKCYFKKNLELFFFKCEKKIFPEIKEELFKRIIKPLYIPLLALIAGSIIISSKQKKNYSKLKNLLFIFAFLTIIFSEISSKYIAYSNELFYFYFLTPLATFALAYFIFYKKTLNV
jgi:lipopolysaccharide export system permease protein